MSYKGSLMSYILANPAKICNTNPKRGNRTIVGSLLQEHTGPVFLTITGDKRSRMSNSVYVRNLNRSRNFTSWKVPFKTINQHDAGALKLKVSASLHTENGRTLLYLDVDTHDGIGKPEDARKLLLAFRKKHFPQMPEPVITDRGGSAWLVVQTRTEYRTGFYNRPEPVAYNSMVEKMQTYLQSLAASMNLDLSGVEVKGKVYEPNMNGKIVLSVKAGDMMKPPPSAAWFTQPVVEWTRLASNEFEPIVVEKQQKQSLIDTKLRLQTSFKPQLVTKDIEARIPLLCQFIEENFKDRPVKAGRFGLKTRQFAEVLLSMYLLKTNEDGSNPVARYEAFITELYKAGVFHYSYNAHRLKAVKDYLSSKGCIDWKDNSYCFGTHQASKWSLCNELVQKMAMVLSPVEQHTQSLIDTSITVDFELCTGQNLQAVYRSKIYASCVYHTDGVSWTPEDLPSLAA